MKHPNEEILNKQYNSLTILSFDKKRNGIPYYNCICKCGNKKSVSFYHIKNGHTKSCGCIKKRKVDPNIKQILNKNFGNLTVIQFVGYKEIGNVGIRSPHYKCICDCGKECVYNAHYIKSGRAKTCGSSICKNGKGKLKNDLTGCVFGKIKVEKFLEFRPRTKVSKKYLAFYLCKCSCGNSKEICGADLIQSVISCGCEHIKSVCKEKYHNAKNKLYLQYKHGADCRGIDFLLSKEQVYNISSQNCHYCNCEPQRVFPNSKVNGKITINGIDRKNNNIGYTLDNCVPCCSICNRGKNSMDYNDFMDYISNIKRSRN